MKKFVYDSIAPLFILSGLTFLFLFFLGFDADYIINMGADVYVVFLFGPAIIILIISNALGGLISLLNRKWTFIGTTRFVLKGVFIIYSLFVVVMGFLYVFRKTAEV